MSEIIKEFKKGDLLYIDKDGKAEWGYPEGYPYKEKKGFRGHYMGWKYRRTNFYLV